MKNQFSIGALFRWTTLVCLICGILQRVMREHIQYDRLKALLLPFFDILWLFGYDSIFQVESFNEPGLITNLIFLIGCILSVGLHTLLLIVAYCLIFGWNKK